METTKVFWKSKTFWTNLLGTLVLILSATDVTPLLPPSFVPYIASVVAVANIVLRSLASQQSGALTLTNKE